MEWYRTIRYIICGKITILNNIDLKDFSNHLCQGHNLHQITGLMGNAILRNHLKWFITPVQLVFGHITDCSIVLNPFTPSDDQIWISPNSFNEVSGKRLLRRKKHVNWQTPSDLTLNSLSENVLKCMADSVENWNLDLRSERGNGCQTLHD